jgi:hypothetical protein
MVGGTMTRFATCPKCHYTYALYEKHPDAPRTTGPGSQWNYIVWLSMKIAEEQGQSWRQALHEACDMAITKGYPYTTSKFGNVEPKDYKEMTVEEASIIITQLQENAAFLGIKEI